MTINLEICYSWNETFRTINVALLASHDWKCEIYSVYVNCLTEHEFNSVGHRSPISQSSKTKPSGEADGSVLYHTI